MYICVNNIAYVFVHTMNVCLCIHRVYMCCTDMCMCITCVYDHTHIFVNICIYLSRIYLYISIICIYMYIFVYIYHLYIFVHIYYAYTEFDGTPTRNSSKCWLGAVYNHTHIFVYITITHTQDSMDKHFHTKSLHRYLYVCTMYICTRPHVCIYVHTCIQESTDGHCATKSSHWVSKVYLTFLLWWFQVCLFVHYDDMGWLWLVGSLKTYVSFAEYSLFHRALLQKSPMFLGSLLIVVTSYRHLNPCNLRFLSVYVSASVSASLRVSAFRFCVLYYMRCLCWSLQTDLFWFWFTYMRIHKERNF